MQGQVGNQQGGQEAGACGLRLGMGYGESLGCGLHWDSVRWVRPGKAGKPFRMGWFEWF